MWGVGRNVGGEGTHKGWVPWVGGDPGGPLLGSGVTEVGKNFIFEVGAFEFQFFEFGIGGWGLVFLKDSDFVVDEVMASDDFREVAVGGFEFFDQAVVFWELLDDVVVFGEHGFGWDCGLFLILDGLRYHRGAYQKIMGEAREKRWVAQKMRSFGFAGVEDDSDLILGRWGICMGER